MISGERLQNLIELGGILHFSILIASAIVPFRLNWRQDLKCLSRLHRQMYWTYAGYIVLSIIAFGCISLTGSAELARGSNLARAFCAYVFVFWGVRVILQGVFDVNEHLTAWWLKLGYAGLTVVFVVLTIIYGWAALGPR